MKRITYFFFIWLAGTLMSANIANAQAVDPWDNFISPTVNLVIEPANHAGSQLFLDLVKEDGYQDIQAWVQHCCKVMAKELYYTVEEANAHGLTQITYTFTDGGALSAKNGAPPHITVSFDLNYLVGFHATHGAEASRDELYGVLCHELIHGYQREPKNSGQYTPGDEFFGFIEGTADLGRLRTGGFNPQRLPSQGHDWKDGYTNTAFFYKWINETIDPEFLIKLNATCRTQDPWTLDKALQELFGDHVSAESLWAQYENEIPFFNQASNGWVGDYVAAGFVAENNTRGFEGMEVRYKNISSNNSIAYEWTFEGGTPATSTDENPTVTYNQSGTYSVTLSVADDGSLSDEKTIAGYIRVYAADDEVDITDFGGVITSEAPEFASTEGLAQFIDNDYLTKGIITAPNSWVQYQADDSYLISSYSITSGKDAEERDPKDWTFEGSVDGINWVLLDTQTEVDFPNRNQTLNFEILNTEAYYFFRLNMTNNGLDYWDQQLLQLSEIELYGKQSAITEKVPVADFDFNPTFIRKDGSIQFTDMSQNLPTSWEWTFEGGSPATSTEQNPVVTYNTAGEYAVTLKAINEAGEHVITLEKCVIVHDYTDFTDKPGAITASSDAYQTFVVGNVIDNDVTNPFLTISGSVDVTFKGNDPFVLKCYSVAVSGYGKDYDPKDWKLHASKDGIAWVELDEQADVDFPSRNQSLEFGVFDNTEAYYYYRISISNPYKDGGGVYDLSELELFGEAGTITAISPVVNFSTASQLIEVGTTIKMSDLSSNLPTEWSWAFEGGNPATSSDQNPIVTYSNPGSYRISLTASNEAGSDVKAIEKYITVVDLGEVVSIITACSQITGNDDSSPAAEGLVNLIDGNPLSKFLIFETSAWVQLVTCESGIVKKYAITSGGDAPGRDPKNWTLKGSVDGTNWEIIDTRSNEAFDARSQRREFIVLQDKAYAHYRLEIENNGDDITQLAELELLGAKDVSTGLETQNIGMQVIEVWPNPADDVLNVKTFSTGSQVSLMALTGQVVVSVNDTAEKVVRLNTGHLSPGIYLLVVEANQEKVVHKVRIR